MNRIQLCFMFIFVLNMTINSYSQEIDFVRFFSSAFENVSSVTVEPNCGASGPYSFPVEVSGLPVLDGRLQFDRIELGLINNDANYDLEITLVSPNGAQYTIADTDVLGSWPSLIEGQQSIYIFNCPGLYPNDNSPMHQFNPADQLFAINGYDMPNMTGTDPNGLWNLLICNRGNEDLAILNANLAFKSVQSYGGINSLSNAADCQSNGTVQYFISQGGCDAVRHLFLGFDDEPLEYFIYDPLDLNGIVSSRELAPGSHVMSVYGAIDDVTPDYDFVRTYQFDLGLDVEDTESPELINCPADTMFYFTTNDTVPVPLMFPTFADNCEVVEATLITRLFDGLTWDDGDSAPDTLDFIELAGMGTGGRFVGTGRVRLDFMVVDAAGNSTACRSTFTFLDSIACANDTETPELINCPTGFTYVSVNDTVNFDITHPTFTDNCQVVTATFLITLTGGTFFEGGGSDPILVNFIDFPGETNAGTILGTGHVRLDYSIVDAAGNTDECSVTYTIIDSIACANDTEAPELINCPSDTVYYSVNDTTVTWITHPTFTDNCQVVTATYLITMNGTSFDDGESGPFLIDFINFPGETNQGIVVGTGTVRLDYSIADAAGNTDECSVTLTFVDSTACVNDTEAPELINCPSDTIYYSVNDTTVTWITHPTFTDNCQVVTATYLITMNGTSFDDGESGPFLIDFINFPGETNQGIVVGTGTVRLDYSIADAAGNTDECSVTLTFVDGNDPCSNDTEDPVFIDCPGDQTIILDDNGSGIFNLTDPNFNDNCTIVTEYLEIDYLGGATDGGNGIEGIYTELSPGTNLSYPIVGVGTVEFDFQVTDQAGNTGQCFVVITSKEPAGPCDNDDTLPVLTNCQANSVVVLDMENRAVVTVVAPNAIDNCGIQTRLVEATYSGGATDENGNTSRSFINFNDGAMRDFTIVGAGTLSIEFLVSDPFGNTSSCITTISTIFGGTEVLFDITEQCIIPGGRLSLPVRVTNFKDIGAFSFDLRLPENSGLSFIGIEDETISNTSFNVLAGNNLRIGWDDPSGNDISLENNTRIFNVIISADAGFSSAVTITSQDVVVLQQGVVVTGKVDLATICVESGVTPSGRIYNPLNKAHANVLVNLIGGSNVVDNINSDEQGGYSFPATNSSFRITPFKNDELTKGITIADVARIRRHFLQKNILDSDYKILAADVNKDGKINIIDVAFTNRVFLRKLNQFPGNTAWRFVPVAADISMNPLNVNIPNTIHLNGSGLDFNNLDFYSIKTGDVDYSALNNVKSPHDGNRFSISLSIPDTVLAPQETVDIPVYLSGDINISALSFNITYDTAILELVSISSAVLNGFSAGSYNDVNGNVLIGWDHPQGNGIDAQGVLMTMTYRNKVLTGRSDMLLEDASFFDSDLNEINVTTQNGSVDFMTSRVKEISTSFNISAQPNPYVDAVTIKVKTDMPQRLKLTFTNVSGDILKEIITDHKSLEHVLVIDDIMAKGVIMVLVEGEDFTKVLKLVKL